MRELLAITNALSDPNRIRIVCALVERGELCVCQLHELLELAPSSTSRHLALLTAAGLLATRREGKWVHYRIAEVDLPHRAEQLIDWISREAAGSRRVIEDRERLDQILGVTKEELSQLQAKGIACCSSGKTSGPTPPEPEKAPGCCGGANAPARVSRT